MALRIRELWQRWQKDFWRVFRFGITGTLCSLIHYGVYCLCLLFTNTTLAYTAGYCVGLVCNYGLTTYFTFRGRPSKRNAAGFAGSHIVNYLLEIGLLHLFLWMDRNSAGTAWESCVNPTEIPWEMKEYGIKSVALQH